MLRFGVRDTKCSVTLYARVWIEIRCFCTNPMFSIVTFYARVWIEILLLSRCSISCCCHPLARGWIEISYKANVPYYVHVSSST